ncbi:DUF3515 domain-containing protein [Rhodococcus sp. NPDC058521]|uniref:DUF3515 domain-containing protein n=1 Tax=Rhodococcus sp. NPDC058521 TaxID=3346536 RepID=UPI00365D289B
MPETDAFEPEQDHRRHPAVIATAVAIPVALVVAVLVAAFLAGRDPIREPVSLGTVPAPASESPECDKLMAALPDNLGDLERAELAEPAPESAAAWQPSEGEPVVLRCGVDRPVEFDQAAPLQVIDGVQWFEVSGAEMGLESSTWYLVDRGVYVAVTIPNGSGPTPLQEMSEAASKALEARPLDPAPLPGS